MLSVMKLFTDKVPCGTSLEAGSAIRLLYNGCFLFYTLHDADMWIDGLANVKRGQEARHVT